MKTIKDLLRSVKLAYKKILYRLAFLITKVDDKVVVFESFQGRSYSCNPKAVFKEMKNDKSFSDYTFYWSFRNTKRNIEGARVVKFESFGYYRALAKAKYWIFNSNVRKFVKPKKNQIFVQTWHGTPLKKIGLDVEISKVDYGIEAKKYSYMISPSRYCTEKLISAFGLKKLGKEKIVLETGYARNDELFGSDAIKKEKVEAVKKHFGIANDKKVILYAPTFRDGRHSQIGGYENAAGMDFDKLKDEIGDQYVVLFRAHYFVARKMNLENYKGFVYDASRYENVNELYLASDLLITDYSSVFFDYANLRRPILFYMYDVDEYKENSRQFYITEKELPGSVYKDQTSLVKAIKDIDTVSWVPDERYKNFNDKFNYLDDGNAARRVIEQIIK